MMHVATIRPGDTIIITLERLINHEQARRIYNELGHHLPNVHIIVIDGVTGFAVKPGRGDTLDDLPGVIGWKDGVVGCSCGHEDCPGCRRNKQG